MSTIFVRVLGAPSTGKSTLSRRLANATGAIYFSEFARDIWGVVDTFSQAINNEILLAGQLRYEMHSYNLQKLMHYKDAIIIHDTTSISTMTYMQILNPPNIRIPSHLKTLFKIAQQQVNYNLTLVLSPDAPFVYDGVRDDVCKNTTYSVTDIVIKYLRDSKWYMLEGDWEDRFNRAYEVLLECIHTHRAKL